METRRLFIAAAALWVAVTVTIYYLYSSGHLLKVSGVGIVVPRLSSLKGLGSTNAPTTTDVRRQQGIEIDAPSGAEEGSPSVSVTGLSTSRTEPITTAPTPTTTAPPSTSSPTLHVGRTKHGSDEQERRLTLAERVELPQDGSDIYISVLTTPGYHDSRLSRQYITWMQTVHPKQVHVVTEGDEDMWTEALKLAGYRVVYCDCPRDAAKTQNQQGEHNKGSSYKADPEMDYECVSYKADPEKKVYSYDADLEKKVSEHDSYEADPEKEVYESGSYEADPERMVSYFMKTDKRMMCCKGGTQFDHWYQAKEAGEVYNWYCHFDDDIYVNTAELIQLTQRFDHTQDQYLGKWKRLSERVYGNSDRISGWTAPGLYNFQERKRNDYRYANGPAYCISAPLMARLEKYLRAQNFVNTCNKAQAVMDDVLPGVIIEAVLGVEVTDIPQITDQLDFPPSDDNFWYLHQITVASEMIQLPSGKYHGRDEVLSYHCLLYPEVSWCK